jgi:hypothetical protein
VKRKAISLNHTKQAALRVEVVFRGLTAAGELRHASFRGIVGSN